MLQVEQLDAGYDRMTVLRKIDLQVKPGEVTLLLGPNGAGKTTLLRAMSGLVNPQGGQITMDGQRIDRWGPERTARQGLRHVMEGHRIFPEITVEDNVRLGQVGLPRSRRRSEREVFDEAFGVFPVLGEKRDLLARSLSGGQQQMLALVQAWAGQPRYLLCDEPSLGLALSLVPDILEFLRRRAAEGTGVLLVEQLIDQPLAYADRVVLIRQGEVRLSGHVSQVGDARSLAQQMLGGVGAGVAGPSV
ncbi:MAG: transporter ATP-binding protein [Marmoricola sp.]|nr:transporter ATP-binding protein [Marmoricola sp.]